MKITCNVVQDMLPLVAEDLASGDTVTLVGEHIKNCPDCKDEYNELKKSKTDFKYEDDLEAAPIRDISRKLKKRRMYTGVLTGLIISLFLVLVFDKTTKAIPLSFNEAIESTRVEDEKLFIKFKEDVSNYDIVSTKGENINYEIMAWKTSLSKFIKNESKTTVIDIENGKSTLVYYISQGDELDKIIYGDNPYSNGGVLTLPRLAMNFYVTAMGLILLVSSVLLFLFRKKSKINKAFTIISFFSGSYILSHLVILGLRGSTHHILRDLAFVGITTILIFSLSILIRYKEKYIS